MHPLEVEEALKTLTAIVDTREQPTPQLTKRLECFQRYERATLNAGDYSGKVLINGGWLQLPVAIERKMNIDELCNNFCKQRPRFEREFNRAKENGVKMYLLIEGGNWESIYNGYYLSHMRSRSLVGSILTWLSRFDCQLLMCNRNISGQLIWDVLYYEARTYLLGMVVDETGQQDSSGAVDC